MDYPKYIEFPNQRILIFSSFLNHRQMAARIDEPPVSAGFIAFATGFEPEMRFFGESTSLGVKSNPDLLLGNEAWYGEAIPDRFAKPVLSNDPQLVEQAGVKASPLPLVVLQDDCGNELTLPAVEGLSEVELAQFSGYFSDPWSVKLRS